MNIYMLTCDGQDERWVVFEKECDASHVPVLGRHMKGCLVLPLVAHPENAVFIISLLSTDILVCHGVRICSAMVMMYKYAYTYMNR